jgi:ATP-dependent Clp protease ATP-binding subunit ClpB
VQIVLFQPLSQADLREIVRHQVGDISKRLEDRDITIKVADAALDVVLRESYNPAFGARPLRRFIEKHLATGISKLLISGELVDHCVVEVKVRPGAAGAGAGAYGIKDIGPMKAGSGDEFVYSVTRKKGF